MTGTINSTTRKLVERAQEANFHEKSVTSESLWHCNGNDKYSPLSFNNSPSDSYRKKVWMNIELMSRGSDNKNSNMYKRSFYRNSARRSNENVNTLNKSINSLNKGLEHSNFIYEE